MELISLAQVKWGSGAEPLDKSWTAFQGGTKTQWRVKGCLERSWLVEWECGWEPTLDRTAKERHIRLHCMHMPGEMGTDRHYCTQGFAQVEHYPVHLQWEVGGGGSWSRIFTFTEHCEAIWKGNRGIHFYQFTTSYWIPLEIWSILAFVCELE